MVAAAAATAPSVPPVGSAPLVLLVLIIVLAASGATFWVLVRREERHRHLLALKEWARDEGFRLRRRPPERLPEPLQALSTAANPRVRIWVEAGATALARFETNAPSSARGSAEVAGAARVDDTANAAAATPPAAAGPMWHVLVRRIEAAWKPTGARPAGAASSVLDLYSLSSFPMLGNPERFVIYGADSAAAAALSASSARALLPPDVGLLLRGRYLLLDFSCRPFDAIELNRMRALADQLVAHLPAPP